jgi:hypothetical protein
MWCNQLIDPNEFAIDMHPDHERQPARYEPIQARRTREEDHHYRVRQRRG